MSRAIDEITDAEMLAVFDSLAGLRRKLPTYVIRNILKHREITSRQVRERLKKMEEAGLVERVGRWTEGRDFEWQPVRKPVSPEAAE